MGPTQKSAARRLRFTDAVCKLHPPGSAPVLVYTHEVISTTIDQFRYIKIQY